MSPRRQDERGAGSVLILAVSMVVVTALLAVAVLVAGQSARRQAAAAADLAALAAAAGVQAGVDDPCAVAARIAVENAAVLRDCVVDGVEVEVQVRVEVRAPLSWLPAQQRRARAGPPRE